MVQVRTDVPPINGFSEVSVELEADDASRDVRMPASADQRWGAGVRVAELAGLPARTYRVQVALRGPDGRIVVERGLRVAVDGGVTVATVLLTVDCIGVECPNADGDPLAAACLAGRCVREDCSEEQAEACGVADCHERGECPPTASSCASSECSESGTCFTVADHVGCGPDRVCNPASGCEVANSDRLDAGVPLDAGVDAGLDAGGADSGRDAAAGVDAAGFGTEVCNGIDDDGDSAVDEGFTRVMSASECAPARPAAAGLRAYEIDLNESWSVTRASLPLGNIEPRNDSDTGWTDKVSDYGIGIGNLLGSPTDALYFASFPDLGFGPTLPNVDRRTIALDWGPDVVVRNEPGDDLFISEEGTHEPFTVRVHDATTDRWGPRVMQDVVLSGDGPLDAGLYLFDFSELGVAEFGVVDRIEIENAFGDGATMPDRAVHPSGVGVIVRAGQPGYDSGHPIQTEGRIAIPELLDADINVVLALRPPIAATCCYVP